ncbi:SET and MYND domain-containing protein 4 [Halotydeus destructor]|nr:SET and MYND domain-containing protein 4 [Halotydeus destructor]
MSNLMDTIELACRNSSGDSSTEFCFFLLFILDIDPQDTQLLSDLSRFSTVENCVDYFLSKRKWVEKLEEVAKKLLKEATLKVKSLEDSRNFREQGNVCVTNKDYVTAIKCYNDALLVLPDSSPDLSLCYNNRSLAYFHLSMFKEAANDAKEAIKAKYPISKQATVRQRLIKSLLFSGQRDLATLELNQAKCLDLNVDTIVKLFDQNSKNFPKNQSKARVVVEPKWVRSQLNGSDYLPDASASVELSHDENKGRSLRASKRIKKGELISREEAAVIILQKQFHSQFCFGCLSELLVEQFTPCPGCIVARYCSTSCLEQYVAEHRVECPQMPFLKHFPIGQTVFRLMTKDGGLIVTIKDDVSASEWSKHRYANDLRSFMSLPGHVECEPLGRLLLTAGAAFISTVIQLTDCCHNRSSKSKDLLEKTLTVLLKVRCSQNGVQRLDHNGHETGHVIGRATNNTLALLNHSCSPNAHFVCHQRMTAVLATRNIGKGEEITHSYLNSEQLRLNCDERRSLLRKRNFFCLCDKCLKASSS